MKVLLVEDDQEMADYVIDGLRERKHDVEHTTDGRLGLLLATGQTHDVIVLDRMLPSLDGLSVVKALRATGVKTPVLYLTTLGGIDDRVEGLEAGGDDYLVKPFALAELMARIRALARRPSHLRNEELVRLSVGDLEIDLLKRVATHAGEAIDLLPQEFRLLEYLMRNAGSAVTRTMLLENVWDIHFDPQTSVVESHISRLRSKISVASGKEFIHTIRKVGYSLRAPD